MMEFLARPSKARGPFRFAAEAKRLIPPSPDFLLAKSHRGLHLLANNERLLRMPAHALRAAYGPEVSIEPHAVGQPVVEVLIGLEKRNLERVRAALSARQANPSEEYDGLHHCVLRFEAPVRTVLGLPSELAEITSDRFSHQIVVTGYR